MFESVSPFAAPAPATDPEVANREYVDDAVATRQLADSDLSDIAALDSSTSGALVTDGSGWIRKTYAQLKTALGLVKADVGLANVDNTSDTAKPVSTAQQAALDGKSDTSHNHSGTYDPAGTAASAVSTHEAAGNPHPTYLTQTEGDALYRKIAPIITDNGSFANGGDWQPAVGNSQTGDIFKATATGAAIDLLVPSGTPTQGLSINLELTASVTTSIVVNAAIILTGGLSTPIPLASGKKWFGGLRYSGSSWYLLASAGQN